MKTSPTRAAWAASKAAEVRRQMQAADLVPAGSNWRDRRRKAALMTRLRRQEARWRLLASPAELGEEPTPF